MGRDGRREMMGGEKGGGEHRLRQERERERQRAEGRAGQRSGGSAPIMHLETGHSDSMRRMGNLPAHICLDATVPRPETVKAQPVVMSTCMLCFQSPACERGRGERLLLPELSLVTKISGAL